ncbi:MAG TPA: tripartite tricarboxylate transporter TctB family protein, partial [Burkholderiales bacterium]
AACIKGLAIQGEPVDRLRFRPLALILGSVGLFAITIETAGIIIATVVTVAVAAAASPDSRTREVVLLIVVMLALAVGVFTYGLGLPFKLMPG